MKLYWIDRYLESIKEADIVVGEDRVDKIVPEGRGCYSVHWADSEFFGDYWDTEEGARQCLKEILERRIQNFERMIGLAKKRLETL